jgi:RNA polymerase sigma-70 factor (ECF subfamily)
LSLEDPGSLIARIATGDEAAFAALYRSLEPRVYRFILSKLNDSFEAADILNETFLEVWRSASSYQGRSKPTTWIFGIAYHKVMDRYRKQRPEDLTDPAELEQADGRADQAAALAALEEGRHLRHCLDELKPAQRAVMELAFYEDLPYREIAEIVDCPEGTVKTRIFHAKEALRRCLSLRMGDGL